MERGERPTPELGQRDGGRFTRIGALAEPVGKDVVAAGTQTQHGDGRRQRIGNNPHPLPQLPHCFGISWSGLAKADGKGVEDQPLDEASPVESVGVGEPIVGERRQ